LRSRPAGQVSPGGAHDAAGVEAAVLVEIPVFQGDGGLLEMIGDLLRLYRDTLDGVIIFPEQGFTGAIVVADAAADVAAGDVAQVGQVFAEVGEHANHDDEDHHYAYAGKFQRHDAALAAEPVFIEALGVKPEE